MMIEVLKRLGQYKLESVTLKNETMTIELLNFGARWHKALIFDRNGKKENVLLSLDCVDDILQDKGQFGAIIGPIAGRTKNGYVSPRIQLEKNEGQHNLHSMPHGWDKQFFTTHVLTDNVVEFTYNDVVSGFASNLSICVRYTLHDYGVDVSMSVRSTEDTYVNPTSHAYFNLAGNAKEDIGLGHTLMVRSAQRVETNESLIPTGMLLDVKGTAYDLRQPRKLQHALQKIKGLDDCFVLDKISDKKPDLVLTHKMNGRKLSIFTDCACIVLFSMTDWCLPIQINGQVMYGQMGLAIEPQEHVDIVHHPAWGSIELLKDEVKEWRTTYVFTVEER